MDEICLQNSVTVIKCVLLDFQFITLCLGHVPTVRWILGPVIVVMT